MSIARSARPTPGIQALLHLSYRSHARRLRRRLAALALPHDGLLTFAELQPGQVVFFCSPVGLAFPNAATRYPFLLDQPRT